MAELPPEQIIGPLRDVVGIPERVYDFYAKERELGKAQFKAEIAHSPERIAALDGLWDAYTELGDDLGLDLRHRLPVPSDYHFFRTKEDLHAALKEIGENPDESLTGRTSGRGIFMLEGNSDYETLCLAAHEAVHWAARHKVKASIDVRTGPGLLLDSARNGYATKAAFMAADEMATDLTYLHLRKGGYWQRQRGLPQKDSTITHYTSLDILGDELIQAVAAANEVSPQAVLSEIERDILTGGGNALRTLARYFADRQEPDERPNAVMREFVHLSHLDVAAVGRLAVAMHLPPTAKERIVSGDQVRVLDWVQASPQVGR